MQTLSTAMRRLATIQAIPGSLRISSWARASLDHTRHVEAARAEARHATFRGGPRRAAQELRSIPPAPAARPGILRRESELRSRDHPDVLQRRGELRCRLHGRIPAGA